MQAGRVTQEGNECKLYTLEDMMYMQSETHTHTHRRTDIYASSKVYHETDPHGKQSALEQLVITFLIKALKSH